MTAIREACEKYIQAVQRAKERAPNLDAFWSDKKAGKAHEAIGKAIEAEVPADLHWWHTIWNLTGSAAERIWGASTAKPEESQQFAELVLAYLDALKGNDWVASLPLERVFSRFPECTDFGSFHLINPNCSDQKHALGLDELLTRFRTILTEKLNITFTPRGNHELESYMWLGDHYYNKSSGYIPGRPQMVLKVGRGDEIVNKALLSQLVQPLLSLLSICQIAYELECGILEKRITDATLCRLPTGGLMQAGLIRVPSVAVSLIEKTGRASWWPVDCAVYETQFGWGYDPVRFKAIWDDIALPIFNLKHNLSGNVSESIRNAISFVARCRHREMGNLTLNSIIATETIINPFHKMGTSEGFGVFAARLTATTTDERIRTYRAARDLYKLRNSAVHQSKPNEGKGFQDSEKIAFNLFLACLKAMLRWVKGTLDQGKQCSEEEFKAFYLRSILA